MLSFNILFKYTLLSFLVATVFAESPVCEENLRNLDDIIKNILLMARNPLVPKNTEEFERYCKQNSKMSHYLNNYRPCATPFQYQIMSLILHGVNKQQKHQCKKFRTESLNSWKCVDNELVKKVQNLAKSFFSYHNYIKMNATSEESLPLLCCSTHLVVHELSNFQSPDCGGKIDAAKFMKNLLEGVIAHSVEIVCGGISTYDECQAKHPNSINKLKRLKVKNIDITKASFFDSVLSSINKIAAVEAR